jgi:hypothetical protein
MTTTSKPTTTGSVPGAPRCQVLADGYAPNELSIESFFPADPETATTLRG